MPSPFFPTPLEEWQFLLARELAGVFHAEAWEARDGTVRFRGQLLVDPERAFATLSDRLTMQDGVLLMSGASLLTLAYTRGETTTLVLMYSINVFITFCLTESSMIRFCWHERAKHAHWIKNISVHITGFCLCFFILVVNIFEKFMEGGWVTLTLTTAFVALCALIKRHYQMVKKNLSRLDEIMTALPSEKPSEAPALDQKAPTAVLLVGGYGGLGVHSMLAIQRLFPGYFKNFIFISVGVIDSATFKGIEAVEDVRDQTEQSLMNYVALAQRWHLAADYRMSLSTEVLDEAEKVCLEVSREFPRAIVFAGKLVFQQERWFQRLLHNETAYQLQRRLQFAGLNTMVLPVRVLSPAPAA